MYVRASLRFRRDRSKYRLIRLPSVIPEMLQNADDATYTDPTPELIFRLCQSEIIVDSNEDGFTRADVEAICSVGNSSKVNDGNTTGEKGVGFKSVFGVAWRVHIQSGHWSFRFQHRRTQGEDELGMITPIWTPAREALPHGVGTRFRLTYADELDNLNDVVAAFKSLSDTTIFATRKLKKLVIAFEGLMDLNYQTSFTKEGSYEEGEIIISSRTRGQSPQQRDTETKIRVFQTTVSDLPKTKLRPSDSSNVVIGFPVDPESGNCTLNERGQQVFAFLPIRRLPQLPVCAGFPRDHVAVLTSDSSFSFKPTLSLRQIEKTSWTSPGTNVFVEVQHRRLSMQYVKSVKILTTSFDILGCGIFPRVQPKDSGMI